MTLSAFYFRWEWNRPRPDHVTEARWKGMVKWAQARVRDGDLLAAISPKG